MSYSVSSVSIQFYGYETVFGFAKYSSQSNSWTVFIPKLAFSDSEWVKFSFVHNIISHVDLITIDGLKSIPYSDNIIVNFERVYRTDPSFHFDVGKSLYNFFSSLGDLHVKFHSSIIKFDQSLAMVIFRNISLTNLVENLSVFISTGEDQISLSTFSSIYDIYEGYRYEMQISLILYTSCMLISELSETDLIEYISVHIPFVLSLTKNGKVIGKFYKNQLNDNLSEGVK